MAQHGTNLFLRGVRFVRDNPQVIYTLSLVVLIPLAFFFTSEQFLRVARENQDKLERNRIGILGGTFALFARDHLTDEVYLNARIDAIAEENETIRNFQILGPRARDGFPILASLDRGEVGANVVPDDVSTFLLSSAAGNPREAFATSFFVVGERYWRGVRAITAATSTETLGYLVVELSMAQADAVARKNILKAYAVLIVIIFLIIILLARQARIIDYAALYKRLKEVDQMKDDFVSMAAHELRTPLTVIRGYAELLKGMIGISSTDRENVERIEVSAQDLSGLVDDILDVARIQEGKMSFTPAPVDIKELLVSVAESFKHSAEEKGLAFRTEIPDTLPVISTDEKRMRQVLVNIIGNSIKYTPQGEVSVRALAEGGNLVIRVSDTGIGIAAEDQKKLFQKFYRVRSRETDDIRGTGLGLWITLQIIQRMKGAISVESIKGKGTDFIITLPITRS